MKSVVISGASSGVGKSMALKMASEGWLVFAGVRDDESAKELSNENAAIIPVMLDVTDEEQLDKAVELIMSKIGNETLGGLVNNAGIAKIAPLSEQPMDEFIQHFNVVVFGSLRISQKLIPLLGGNKKRSGQPGRIVNITSVGGEVPSPFLGAYTASKHALESVTDTLRRELVVYGIDSISIGPGSVKTPIWKKAKDDDAPKRYGNSPWASSIKKFLNAMVQGGEEGLAPEIIADVVYQALTADKPKARYAPVPNKFINYTLLTTLPERWVDRIFWKKFGIDKAS
ncbi:MAG: NAD(P)-dependent dehydrogenase (short-subunit alcohol dehydrogenase family) [Bermanella sp.]|jgi:NAD(P)-dependent dehydrogenase (short-subunit alcohol dehydrogenase family)